ncbi:UNVERIFIED_CONTAM: Tubulin epsilon chain [Trichonephila clavipes]
MKSKHGTILAFLFYSLNQIHGFSFIGQCGNQIGYRFWDLAVQEYQFYRTCTEDINSFFKIIDTPRKSSCDFLDSVKARFFFKYIIQAILIDMEEGVVSEILNGPLKCIFDRQQLVTDVSGSGNNWAVGNKFYGSKYRSRLIDLFRKEVEECDTLQCFFLLHSMGGGMTGMVTTLEDALIQPISSSIKPVLHQPSWSPRCSSNVIFVCLQIFCSAGHQMLPWCLRRTGSGLGTATLEYLSDEFPKIPR